jgi:hypothetical protein
MVKNDFPNNEGWIRLLSKTVHLSYVSVVSIIFCSGHPKHIYLLHKEVDRCLRNKKQG